MTDRDPNPGKCSQCGQMVDERCDDAHVCRACHKSLTFESCIDGSWADQQYRDRGMTPPRLRESAIAAMQEPEPSSLGERFAIEMFEALVLSELSQVLYPNSGSIPKAITNIARMIWRAGSTAAQQRLESFTDEELEIEMRRRAQGRS